MKFTTLHLLILTLFFCLGIRVGYTAGWLHGHQSWGRPFQDMPPAEVIKREQLITTLTNRIAELERQLPPESEGPAE